MAAKILILCAIFGAVTAEWDSEQNINVEYIRRINEDIIFCDDVFIKAKQFIDNFSKNFEGKTKKIGDLKRSLEAEIRWASEHLRNKKLKTLFSLINDIHHGVARCISEVFDDFYYPYEAYLNRHRRPRDELNALLESIKNGYCNTDVSEDDECHRKIEEKRLHETEIANRTAKVQIARAASIVFYFADNPVYHVCLNTVLVLPTMRKWDEVIKALEKKFKNPYYAKAVRNETKSKLRISWVMLSKAMDAYVVEIKTWTQGDGKFAGSFYFDL